MRGVTQELDAPIGNVGMAHRWRGAVAPGVGTVVADKDGRRERGQLCIAIPRPATLLRGDPVRAIAAR